MKALIPVFLFLIVRISFSQDDETPVSWAQTLDGYNTVDFTDMDVDSKGNTFMSVLYQGKLSTPKLETVLPDAGHFSGAIVKYDPAGTPLWLLGVKGASIALISSIYVTKNGDFIITGNADGEMTFNSVSKEPVIAGEKKDADQYNHPWFLYIARYSNDGDLIWLKTFATNVTGTGTSVVETSKGELYWALNHKGKLFDGEKLIGEAESKPHNDSQYQIFKLSAQGEILHQHPFVYQSWESNYMYHSRLTIDHEDALIVNGQFQGAIHFNEKDSLNNDAYYEAYDGFIAKFDANENYLWNRKIGGQYYQTITSLRVDKKGRISVIGYYGYECVISSGIQLVQKSQYDYKSGASMFYCRFKEDGQLEFSKFHRQNGWNGNINAMAMGIDENSRAHYVGMFTDTLRLEGTDIVIPGKNEIGTTYYTRWNGDSLETVSKPIDSGNGWIGYMDAVIKNNKMYVGGVYAASNCIENVAGSKFQFSERDYGRSSFVYSFQIPDLPEIEDEENNYEETIESAIACLSPKRIAEPNVWIPIQNVHIAQTPTLWGSNDCGVVLEDRSAILFPNPTEALTTLTVNGLKGNLTIQVFSAAGQFLFAQDINILLDEQSIELNFAGVEPGTYYIQLVQGNYKKILPLVKSH